MFAEMLGAFGRLAARGVSRWTIPATNGSSGQVAQWREQAVELARGRDRDPELGLDL